MSASAPRRQEPNSTYFPPRSNSASTTTKATTLPLPLTAQASSPSLRQATTPPFPTLLPPRLRCRVPATSARHRRPTSRSICPLASSPPTAAVQRNSPPCPLHSRSPAPRSPSPSPALPPTAISPQPTTRSSTTKYPPHRSPKSSPLPPRPTTALQPTPPPPPSTSP